MSEDWYNNEISKKLYNEYNHDFSICDIDGVCRKFYFDRGIWKTRLVIYESKYEHERTTQTQLGTLFELDRNINWTNFDQYSGVYLIKHDENLTELKVYKIINTSETTKPLYELSYIKTLDMDRFYNWISVKDIEQNYGLKHA